MSQMQSSGRGGAGNIVDVSKTPKPQPEDLRTPTLKTSMVTTGRGGTGNFAAGLDAEEKRRRQDVEPVIRRDSQGATHIGRGGTGNVVKTGGAEDGAALDLAKTRSRGGGAEKSPSPPSNNNNTPSGPGGDGAADDVLARKPEEEKGLVGKALGLVFGKK